MIVSPTRRRLLQGLGVVALAAPSIVRSQAIFGDYPFSLGVASGEPAADGFVLWTRLAPRPLEPHGGMPMQPTAVQYEIAEDDGFSRIVQKGEALARPELAHSVHVEVGGLQPGRPYWYRFTAGSERSGPGRAKTLPAAGARVQKLRFASAGCQHYEQGLYTAYGHLAAENELDFVYHYGDYIYEGRDAATYRSGSTVSTNPRQHVGDEIYSLDDYRRRYAQYKTDPDLQTAHAAAPWFTTFDDHEVDNNWAGPTDQDDTPPELFALRKAAAFQAYYEHMPLRRASLPSGASIKVNRRAAFGDLMQAHFLDTRQYRTDQPCGDNFKPACPAMTAEQAAMLGAEQERWLGEGLRNPTRWNLLAQQVMVLRLDRRTTEAATGERTYNMDSWAGYVAPQQRLLRQIQQQRLKNVVILTGDEHQNYANEIPAEGAGWSEGPAVATEFVSTSITSGGDGQDQRRGTDRLLARNPRCKFNNAQRGYIVGEVTPEAWRTDYRVVDQVRAPGGKLSTRASFAVEPGRPGLQTA